MIRNTSTNAKGTAGVMLRARVLDWGMNFWITEPTTPNASAAPSATPRLRRRATTTAAKAPAMSRVKLSGSRPITGAISTPARPARNDPVAQTASSTACGLVPTSRVMVRESTNARTTRPAAVRRRISVPATTTPITHPRTITWSRVTGTPNGWYTVADEGARPGADRIVFSPNIMVVSGGRATETPTRATTFAMVDEADRKRNRTAQSRAPSAGPITRIESSAAAQIGQPAWEWK